MSLEKYNQKRNFGETTEPAGKEQQHKGKLRFVVQRHEASTLHYDFRLEMEGVLKSWAVPKGPSLNPADKRLAMEVEDHPFSYRTFEGTIPEGNYGAGRVAIWDEGTYHAAETDEPEKEEEYLLRGLQEGSIKFVLEGEKLRGEFSLIKMKGRQKGAWLLVKKKDDEAVTEDYDSEEHLGNITVTKPAKPAKKATEKKFTSAKRIPKSSPEKSSKDDSREELEIAGQTVSFSNLDKFYWPAEGITKGDLIAYYQGIADVLLPYLQDRPQSLLRHPNGAEKPGFYQKDIDHTPDWVRTVALHAESTGKDVDYLVCDNKATLAYMNNLGCIQLNPWNSRLAHLENPDYLVIDLDPDENPYDEVVETALVTKELLDKAGAASFVKTSGATGMHIYVPLGARYTFEQAKQFAHVVARMVHEQLPTLTSLERNPKSRKGKIYLDFLQNAIAQTVAAPYSVRPRAGAPVSAPLRWEEVKPGLRPTDFTILNMPDRIRQLDDIFNGVLGKGVDLPACLKKLDSTQT
ncbi:non-homologous end-joining DNA ligase [Pontibacter sp. HSC-36F09]|uniref:non-homologous end-joining DNA ligase n=1 Tax=Pontibacter sp. HSC-36F09 TaxID=2910966 RepID=UPI0020A09E17|nr:non-homologous end-joining DNA ligase [Pontibacter sp. HSC-36F09]MCP2044243.1 bifunctional non-homologous end joining protein LigD [Pontibacter sp. HSC-36F09]